MKISRRQFLKGLAVTAAAAALPRFPPLEELGTAKPLLIALHSPYGEIDAPSYARQPGHWGETVFFPQASSDWGVVSGVAIFDSHGLLLYERADFPAKYICWGDTVAVTLNDDVEGGKG